MYPIIHVYSCLQMLMYVYSCICEYMAGIYANVCQKLYVPNDLCTQLFADANIHIQLYMRVSILISVKSCIYM